MLETNNKFWKKGYNYADQIYGTDPTASQF